MTVISETFREIYRNRNCFSHNKRKYNLSHNWYITTAPSLCVTIPTIHLYLCINDNYDVNYSDNQFIFDKNAITVSNYQLKSFISVNPVAFMCAIFASMIDINT